jgi:hypothetical protein
MEIVCPRCWSADVFAFWEKRKKDDWALCRNCFKRAPLYKFRNIEYPGYWDYIDDRIKEEKIQLRIDS